jgi:hypothetical protein
MTSHEISERTRAALNRLCKWRSVFAGWQLGTRDQEDPECQAVKDHRELSMLLRAEVSALVATLVQKGVFTVDEFNTNLEKEAVTMDVENEQRFPGFSSIAQGISMSMPEAAETMKNWPK